MKETAIINIDLAKRVFQLHGAAAEGLRLGTSGQKSFRFPDLSY